MERSNWKQVFSKSKQRHYWFNEATGVTQWTEPASVQELAAVTVPNSECNLDVADNSKKRKRDETIVTNSSSTTVEIHAQTSSQLPKVAVVVPFRDLHHEQKRAEHLARFIPEMASFLMLGENDFHIYIVEQSNDGRKFNRGKLLNIGFDLAKKDDCAIFIFHDVDLIPSSDLISSYTADPSSSGPCHIARVWDRYSEHDTGYFGGIVSFSEEQFRQINGFPNNYWGWGGEDEEMKRRVDKVGLKITHPSRGSIEDMEKMTLEEKVKFLRNHKEWKCMMKWELAAEHPTTWQLNGLAQLEYSVCNRREMLDKKCSVVTVDVKLNNHLPTDTKCGV